MKKRMIATALAGIMTVFVLASGCGNEGSEGRDTQKRTESQTGTEVKKDKKEEKVVKPKKKAEDSQNGENIGSSAENEDITEKSVSGSSGQEDEDMGEEEADMKEISDGEENTDNSGESDDSTEEPEENRAVTGTIQEISSSRVGIMEADGGVYGFDTGILSGFDDSYQIGDTVTVTYDGDLMNPDGAAITH